MKRLQNLALGAAILLVAVLVGSALLGLFHPGEPAPQNVEAMVDGQRLRVEVLNGAGVAGLARSATRVLRRQNFDVVYYGNAPGGSRDSSVVIDRVGREEEAWLVAEALGIRQVVSEPDSTLYLEATVVLGRDWAEEPGEEEAPPQEVSARRSGPVDDPR